MKKTFAYASVVLLSLVLLLASTFLLVSAHQRVSPIERMRRVQEVAKLSGAYKFHTEIDSISDYAPRILTIKINPEKIGKVIGPGGKGIKAIEAETKATIDIEEDGTILVSCIDMARAQRAVEMIEAVTAEVKLGKIYKGRVVSIKDFGAFIEIGPGQEGLCNISEMDTGYVKSVNSVVKFGEEVRVKVIAIDDQGRVKLSRKAALMEEAAPV